MSVQVQIRRGNTSQHSSFTGVEGEVTADIEKKTLVLHDGSTAGGFPLITAFAKQSIIPSTDNTFSLGNSTYSWSELYISGNTIFIGNQTITSNTSGVNLSGGLFVDGTSVANSTVVNLGANVLLDTSQLSIGNSTVNTVINSTSINSGNVSFSGFANISSTLASGNVSVTGFINVSSTANIGGVLNARANIEANGQLIVANTASLGNTTINGFANVLSTIDVVGSLTVTNTVSFGNTTITGFANVDSSISVGSNVVANVSSIKVGNGTTNTLIEKNIIKVGNSTVNSILTTSSLTTANIIATNLSGNGSLITSIDANNISTGTLDSARLATSGVAANTYGNSSSIPVITIDAYGRITNANTTAVAGVTNVVYTESNTTLVVSTGDGSSFATNFGTANSTYNGFIKVIDSISNTSVDIAASANSVKTAYDAAGNAYSNATSFAANADNITSGTLNTARFPSTANVSTSINVGANVNLTTDRINVGNSTVNSFITATGIETSGVLIVANTATFSNGISLSNTIIANVAAPSTSTDAANKAYVDEVAQGIKVRTNARVLVNFNLDATYNNLTSNATLTSANTDPFPSIDGIDTTELNVVSTRVLVTAQSNAAHNGLYVLDVPGGSSVSWVLRRCRECDESSEVPGSYVFVKNGTTYGTTGWVAVVANPSTFTIGTDAINWSQFSGSGTFTAGAFLYLNGNQFNANASSNNTSSVLVARNSDGSFSANVISINSLSASNGQFTGPVSGITTLAAGNTTITGFANVSSTLASGNVSVTGFINVSSTANIGGVLTARANVVANGQLIVSNTASLGNTTITGFANVSSTISVGNSSSNVILTSGSVSVSDYNQSYVTHTTSNTSAQTFNSFPLASFRSAQYFIQLTSGSNYHSINLTLIHNGTTVWLAQYGEVFSSSVLGAFTASISGSNVVVSVTPSNAVTVLKAVRTVIAV